MLLAMKTATILGIETSCDETGVALLTGHITKQGYQLELREHLLHSQIALHKKTGGVVPEVAAREHAVRLPNLLHELGERVGHKKLQKTIDAIAVTNGPGLVTSLLVGVEVARTIAYAWGKPLVPVNHLEGHIYANLIQDLQGQKSNDKSQKFEFPLLALLVSGGHTELVLMKNHLSYKIIGTTLDDAVGEAFDKSAKLMGLPYPGGPVLAKLAAEGKRDAIQFPRPMLDRPGFDFSFSGIKTSVATYLAKHPRANKKNVSASFEEAVIETLVTKTIRAIDKYKPKTVALAGGVSANKYLREMMRARVTTECPGVNVLEPLLPFSTDNGAMIAAAGAVRFLNGHTVGWDKVTVNPNLPLK